ncbi:hypothetical protein N665_0026s0066 [Sinapis alba]|nr:hypothetical protein N665_0026s0066 [Sinapis alba]
MAKDYNNPSTKRCNLYIYKRVCLPPVEPRRPPRQEVVDCGARIEASPPTGSLTIVLHSSNDLSLNASYIFFSESAIIKRLVHKEDMKKIEEDREE